MATINTMEEYKKAIAEVESSKKQIILSFCELEAKKIEKTKNKIINRLLKIEEFDNKAYFIIRSEHFEQHLKIELQKIYNKLKTSYSKRKREQIIMNINVLNFFNSFKYEK